MEGPSLESPSSSTVSAFGSGFLWVVEDLLEGSAEGAYLGEKPLHPQPQLSGRSGFRLRTTQAVRLQYSQNCLYVGMYVCVCLSYLRITYVIIGSCVSLLYSCSYMCGCVYIICIFVFMHTHIPVHVLLKGDLQLGRVWGVQNLSFHRAWRGWSFTTP